jgi:hypothetical protein
MTKNDEIKKLDLVPVDIGQALVLLVQNPGRVALIEPPFYNEIVKIYGWVFEECAIKLWFDGKCFRQSFLTSHNDCDDIDELLKSLKELCERDESILSANSQKSSFELTHDNWHDLNIYVRRIWRS